MKKIAIMFLVLTGLMFADIAATRADLMITPIRAVFDGRDRSKVITLINTSNKTRTYRMGWVLYTLNDQGNYEEVETLTGPDGKDRSAMEMIRFSPRQVTIEPQGRQRIRLSLRRPADLEPGEYRAHLSITRLADDGVDNLNSSRQGASTVMKLNLAFSIPVIVREGDLQPNVEMQSPEFVNTVKDGKADPKLYFKLVNKGSEVSSYGQVKAYWTPSSGQTEEVGLLNNVSLYPENESRNYSIRIKKNSLSNGILTLVYSGQEEYKDVIFDKKSFNIK